MNTKRLIRNSVGILLLAGLVAGAGCVGWIWRQSKTNPLGQPCSAARTNTMMSALTGDSASVLYGASSGQVGLLLGPPDTVEHYPYGPLGPGEAVWCYCDGGVVFSKEERVNNVKYPWSATVSQD